MYLNLLVLLLVYLMTKSTESPVPDNTLLVFMLLLIMMTMKIRKKFVPHENLLNSI